jgi:hypothetical protein
MSDGRRDYLPQFYSGIALGTSSSFVAIPKFAVRRLR